MLLYCSLKHQCIKGQSSKCLHSICHPKSCVKLLMFSYGWVISRILVCNKLEFSFFFSLLCISSWLNCLVVWFVLNLSVGWTWNRWSLCTSYLPRSICELPLPPLILTCKSINQFWWSMLFVIVVCIFSHDWLQTLPLHFLLSLSVMFVLFWCFFMGQQSEVTITDPPLPETPRCTVHHLPQSHNTFVIGASPRHLCFNARNFRGFMWT